ncbi:MAG TPA: PHB depolymerase family esterase, partial [Chitinophagales bacterium]
MNRFFTAIAVVLLTTSAFSQQNIIDSFQAGGVYRNFILHVPQGYNSANKYSLVLNLHGFTSNANTQMTNTKMNDLADTDAEPFFVVYPNGLNSSWEPLNTSSDDVSFLSALIDTISARYTIDSTAVFSCGYSNGGITSYLLACQLSDKIASIAS